MDEGRIYVRVTGKAISKKELEIYFQSRKQSGGGDISSIEQINDEESIITFEDQEGKFFTYLHSSLNFREDDVSSNSKTFFFCKQGY